MFGRKNPQRNYQQPPPIPKKVGPTYIAPNSEFQGSMHVEGDLLVDGIVHGSVEVRGDVVISETGLIEGPELRAKNLVVHGVLKSRVSLEGTLTLSRTARLEGDVNANALSIEAGAFYIGYIETGDVKALPISRTRPELTGTSDEYYSKEGF
ncbi:MAG: polymer-forming cytoskeletal protein [Leptolyngbyaceae cyanobacterium HOT.MB2.61]|jgi:cytoskeletal protein CcmA (bactofilin family)|nr:polymer-forming cytoskeletal protein [Leptolyngbyaceae cyanobacterium HOT.MB2.61]